MTPVERFMSHVAVHPDGCWHWTACRDRLGYGRWSSKGLSCRAAHRWAYRLLVGPIPEGLEIDHLCRVRHCVNPAHLEAVTRRENIMRSDNHVAAQARQTHCKRRHEFTPENTLVSPGRGRECRACAHAKYLRRRAS